MAIDVKKEGNMFSWTISWEDEVIKPANEGRFREAFSVADSLIDSMAEDLLREVYSTFEAQDLINEIHYLRGRVNFDGLVLLEILKSKTVVDEQLISRVRQFKKARNLVLHNPLGHHELLSPHEKYEVKDEEFNKVTKSEALTWLDEALKIYSTLSHLFNEIRKKGPKYYTSDEFYKSNPRSRSFDKIYPSKPKNSPL